jgi:hypothetical protein
MREQIQSTLTTLSDATEISDPCSVDWNQFNITEQTTTYTVTSFDRVKPYYISQLFYGSIEYLDIILLINHVDDPFNMRIGLQLIIPSVNDINSFILSQKQKKFSSTGKSS